MAVMEGRFNVPAARFSAHFGDSGKNGRITINGMAAEYRSSTYISNPHGRC